MSNWFEEKPLLSKDKSVLSQTYNLKYGEYDYTNDSRSMDSTFLNVFEYSFLNDDLDNIIICGANNGYEVDIVQKLKPSSKITAVDISDIALKKLNARFPSVDCLHEDLENLKTVKQMQFDAYICLRAIHSSNVNIENALKEAVRVTKNKIVLSISNGYIIDGKLVKGMYEYETGAIDPKKPYAITDKIFASLNRRGWETSSHESKAEIFISSIPRK